MERIKEFLKKHSELLTIPLGLVIWFEFLWLAKVFGLSTYDTGIFQKLIFAAVAILIIKGLTWFILGIDQPAFKRLLDPENEAKWFYLSEKDRYRYAFILYVVYFAAFTLIVALV